MKAAIVGCGSIAHVHAKSILALGHELVALADIDPTHAAAFSREFGGKTYKAEGHVFNPDKSYGYGGCETLEALNEAVVKLYMDEVVPCVRNGLCASIYTQVSDVEDEINGLVTYERKVEKMDSAKMLPIAAALQQAVEE